MVVGCVLPSACKGIVHAAASGPLPMVGGSKRLAWWSNRNQIRISKLMRFNRHDNVEDSAMDVVRVDLLDALPEPRVKFDNIDDSRCSASLIESFCFRQQPRTKAGPTESAGRA